MLKSLINKKVYCEIASISGGGARATTPVLGLLTGVDEKFIEIIIEKASVFDRLNILKAKDSKKIIIPVDRINFIIEMVEST